MTFISSTLVVDESGTLLVEIRWALECSPFFLTRPAECRYRSIGSFRKYSQKGHHEELSMGVRYNVGNGVRVFGLQWWFHGGQGFCGRPPECG